MRLGRGELGHGLGALRDGVLGELTGEDEADGSLDLARGKSGLLVDASELQKGKQNKGKVSITFTRPDQTVLLPRSGKIDLTTAQPGRNTPAA